MIDGFAFEKGQAYIGTSTLDRRRQKVFVVVGRSGLTLSLTTVGRVYREQVESVFGTETVRVRDADGFDYFASARLPVDIAEAFRIVALCEGARPRTGAARGRAARSATDDDARDRGLAPSAQDRDADGLSARAARGAAAATGSAA